MGAISKSCAVAERNSAGISCTLGLGSVGHSIKAPDVIHNCRGGVRKRGCNSCQHLARVCQWYYGIDAIALCRPKGVLGASWGTSGGRQGSCSGLGFLGGLRASISGVVALAPAKLSDLIGQEYFGAKITQAYVEVMCSKAK